MSFYFPLPEKVTKSQIVYNCEKCGLHKKNDKMQNSHFAPVVGSKYDGLVIIANKPSIEDDTKGMPLINEKAKMVRSTFLKNRINLANESAITYASCCLSHKVTDVQFKCCRELLAPRLLELKPKLIVTLGEMAFKSVMGLKNKIGATKIRNRIVPNFEFNCLVFPVFDPNILNSYHYKYALQKDIERICKAWNKNYRKRTYINKIVKQRKILENITIHEVKPYEIDSAFEQIHQLKEVALDYETTNLNPFDQFFEITHISFGLKQTAWVFHESLWMDDLIAWNSIQFNMVKFLTNPNILKIIQNAKFEDLCSRYVFKIKKLVKSFCTMLATHVVDERKGCTSLDFQNLMRFGIPPYSETVKSFLKKKNKDDKCNDIRNAPYDDMITYAGLDVITTYNNYLVLDGSILPNSYDKAYDNYRMLHKGHWVFANMTQRGIPIGEKEFDSIDVELELNINKVIKEITEIPEFIEYNDYLKDKVVNKSSGDKAVKELIQSTKRKENDNDTIAENLKRINGRINRKISFS